MLPLAFERECSSSCQLQPKMRAVGLPEFHLQEIPPLVGTRHCLNSLLISCFGQHHNLTNLDIHTPLCNHQIPQKQVHLEVHHRTAITYVSEIMLQ
jgi:hypothetical protein